MRQLERFNPQELANTVLACAQAGHHNPRLSDAITEEALSRLPDFNPQDLANTAWALAALGELDAETLCRLASAPQLSPAGSGLVLRQLHQAELAVQLRSPAGSPAALPEPLRTQARAAWMEAVHRSRASKLLQDVVATLGRLGMECKAEWACADGQFLADAMVRVGGEEVLVEVDEPYRVVRVPFFEWEALCGPGEKEAYMAAKLGLHE
eukprot:jgi/Tetstr1/457905/TSEL_044423.t1